MKAILKIEGMMCAHCQAHVEKALNALPNTAAIVDLEAGTATVTGSAALDHEALKNAVTEAGYQVVSVESC